MAFPWLAADGLAAHRVRRLYLFWTNEPNDLGRRLGDHRAQDRGPARPCQPDPRAERLAERIGAWAAEEGEPIGVAAAEALRLS